MPLVLVLSFLLLSVPAWAALETSAVPARQSSTPICNELGNLWVDTTGTPSLKVCTSVGANTWTAVAGASGVPSGLITFIVTGTCPTGWTEVAALAGKTLFGTVAANADVGTTGGNDTITPTVNSLTAAAQTVNSLTAAAQTVNSLTAAAQTFTGDSTTVPALGAGTLTTAWPAGAPTQSGETFGTTKFTTSGSGTAAFTSQTSTGTHAWPAATPTISGSTATGTLTPLGHNATSAVTGTMNSSAVTGTMNSSAVTGTLNSFDNRSAFTKVIFCSKD